MTDPRDGKRVALKKLPNVFQSLVSSKRVFRELKMMRFFQHENVLSCLDILQVGNWIIILCLSHLSMIHLVDVGCLKHLPRLPH